MQATPSQKRTLHINLAYEAPMSAQLHRSAFNFSIYILTLKDWADIKGLGISWIGTGWARGGGRSTSHTTKNELQRHQVPTCLQSPIMNKQHKANPGAKCVLFLLPSLVLLQNYTFKAPFPWWQNGAPWQPCLQQAVCRSVPLFLLLCLLSLEKKAELRTYHSAKMEIDIHYFYLKIEVSLEPLSLSRDS